MNLDSFSDDVADVACCFVLFHFVIFHYLIGTIFMFISINKNNCNGDSKTNIFHLGSIYHRPSGYVVASGQ